MHLVILVGTVTQTAQGVAQALSLAAAAPLTQVRIVPMDGLDLTVFDEATASQTVYLMCCSTTGSGNVPENAHAFLQAFSTRPRYLGHVRYGMIALGDSSYGTTFCQGGLQLDDKLQDLGARRIGEVLCHDACSGTLAEDEALAWLAAWQRQISQT